eukprot:1794467-Rhodomonas_salina.2
MQSIANLALKSQYHPLDPTRHRDRGQAPPAVSWMFMFSISAARSAANLRERESASGESTGYCQEKHLCSMWTALACPLSLSLLQGVGRGGGRRGGRKGKNRTHTWQRARDIPTSADT